jgi:hypothetical protein
MMESAVSTQNWPNQALERTADRRIKKVEMLSRLAVEMKTCAPVSGRSAYSR